MGEVVECFRQNVEVGSPVHFRYYVLLLIHAIIGHPVHASELRCPPVSSTYLICKLNLIFTLISDCTKLNIMMDPTKLYPKGFIPERPYMKADDSGFVSPSCTRTTCWPRYFLIDFGHSRRYDPADGIPHEWVLRGGDKTAPEHRNPDALQCNPFPTDIYYLGNLLREYFLDASARNRAVLILNFTYRLKTIAIPPESVSTFHGC